MALATAGFIAAASSCGGGATSPAPPASHPLAAGANHRPAGARDRLARRRVYLGRSVDGRRIYAVKVGDLDNPRSVLVVGDIHGNESAGIPVARTLAASHPRRESLLIVVKDLNPDGVAAGTRQNADGVDLNRNFPYRWRPLDTPGGLQYAGPHPLSEPEARIAHSLIQRARPKVTIWFHQPLGLVDESGGSISVERRFSRATGLPLRRLRRYPGSAAGWQNHRLPGTTAFVVELPSGRLSSASVARYAAAVKSLNRS
jgi:murein peptide amidase A